MSPGWCERLGGFALQWRVVLESQIDGQVLCFALVIWVEALPERVSQIILIALEEG
jgi:hypothetical protein